MITSSNFRLPTIAIVISLAFLVSRADAQQSRMELLAETYKQQNPQTAKKSKTPRQANPNPGGYLPPPQNSPSLGLIHDPLARPDQLINQPPQNSSQPVVQMAYGPQGVYDGRGAGRPIGNLRDPLNVNFNPEANSIPGLPPSPYDEMQLDSRLNDVFFLNPKQGWAVGDHGVVWSTLDGGKKWSQQSTPIDCPLHSIHFVNENVGFVVGGFQHSFATRGGGRGVILTTSDGGKKWTLFPAVDLPILHKVRMLDPMRAWIAGESSELYPSGILRTEDGGRHWKPTEGGKSEGWADIDFYDEKNGVGIGSQGTVQILRGTPKLSRTPDLGTGRINGLKLDPTPKGLFAWLVGEKGLVLWTNDRGLRWNTVSGSLPGNAATAVDLNTLDTQSGVFWVAGNPGTFIYSSFNRGKTWKGTPTGVNVPIRKLCFLDEKNGFAVGDLGTILATNDGGDSWKIQRSGGKRLAVLGLFGQADEIPYEAFVRLCAEQGYLGGTLLLFRESSKQHENFESTWIDRVHEAMLRCGAVGGWDLGMFSLDRDEIRLTPEQIVQRLQKENDGKGLQMLRERLVAAIRQWKPDVVFSSGLESGREKDPLREFVLREVVEAVKQAGDPKAFPHQQTELGLAPWSVKKIHLALADGAFGDVNIQVLEGSARLGQPYDEIAYISRGLTGKSQKVRPSILGFSTSKDDCPPAANRDFLAGLEIPPASDCRRALIGSYADRWSEVQALIQHRRHSLGILQNMSANAAAGGRQATKTQLAATASELLRKVDQDAAVRALLEMGRQFAQNGDWDAAVDAFNMVAEQYSQHPLSRDAFRWLLQYYSSAETNWRLQQKNSVTSGGVVGTGKGIAAVAQTGSAAGFGSSRQEQQNRWERAAAIGRYLDQTMPDLAKDTQIRFSLASMQLRSGAGPEALRYFQARGRSQYDDVWGMRARGEHWLSIDDRTKLPPEMAESPLPMIRCAFTAAKPYLDGQFDKNFDQGTWFSSKMYTLTPEKPRKRLGELLKQETDDDKTVGIQREEKSLAASKNFGTQVMFMYDKQYLYVGIRSKRAAGFSYPPTAEKPRSRDANIDDQDRVEILLDVDRDYGTYYTLAVDSRGWVVDSCWGDKSWNPSWYVARHEDKNYWYIEAAIPLDSLTDQFPMPKTVWAVGIRRIVPGQGIECWNAENSFDLAEGLGLLLFE